MELVHLPSFKLNLLPVMRIPRKHLISPQQEQCGSVYHLVSRSVWREFVFKKEGREYFVELMRKQADFSDLKVLGYCIMSNHVHIMVYVPPRRDDEITDGQFLEQLGHLYSEAQVSDVAERLVSARSNPDEDKRRVLVEQIRAPYLRRMWNFSEFMRAIKQGYSRWFNKREGKKGTLWQGRFTSIQVQGGWHARFIAAYIDLNPLRAGIVDDPHQYRWSGYGAAVGGEQSTRDALLCTMLHESTMELFEAWQSVGREKMHEYLAALRAEEQAEKGPAAQGVFFDWRSQSARYRCFFAEEGQAGGEGAARKRRLGFDAQKVQKILDDGGKLQVSEMLQCRLRFAVDGLIFGTKEFVEEGFKALKGSLPEAYGNRKQGAKKMSFTRDEHFYAHRRHLKRACVLTHE